MDVGRYLLAFEARLRAHNRAARQIARTEMEYEVFGADRTARSDTEWGLVNAEQIGMRTLLREFFEGLRDEDLADDIGVSEGRRVVRLDDRRKAA